MLHALLQLLRPAKPQSIGALIMRAAVRNGVRAELLAALVVQESSANPFAYRYEPSFYGRYIDGRTKARLGGHWPRLISHVSERHARATSFGLCQIMGQVAREHGFGAESLLELCDPEENLELGARILKKHLKKFKNDPLLEQERKALLRYNGGGNPQYATDVKARIKSGEAEALLNN